MSKKLTYLILLCIGITFSSFLFIDHLYADEIVEPASVRPQGIEIVGGRDVPDPNPYKWQVALSSKDAIDDFEGQFCGGSVIGDRWILTAAHCLVNDNLEFYEPLNNLKVIVDRRVLSESNEGMEFDVVYRKVHENYTGFTFIGNDIALLQLASPIPNSEQFIVPLMTTIQESSIGSPGIMSVMTGWGGIIGKDGGEQVNQIFPEILKMAEVPIVSNETCSRIYDDVTLDKMICAGFSDGRTESGNRQGPCGGDSGGPLVVPDGNGGFVQSGIVSFGIGCASTFAVFTRVSSFIDWIEYHTGIKYLDRPDLVLQRITATGNSIEITIKNRGIGPVPPEHDFWVDVYVNPDTQPEAMNEIWEFQGTHGAVWGVESPTVPMQPGDTIVLTIGGQYYHEDKSNFPAALSPGDQIYVQVDSANANNDTYGGVLEDHERDRGVYNNVVPLPFIVGDPVAFASVAQQQVPTTRIYLPMIMTHTDSSGSIQAAMVSTDDNDSLGTNLPLRLR